jgi:predicted TPR repeat methyltransferase
VAIAGIAVTTDDLLAQGLRRLQAGQVTEAERSFREILATQPDHAESLHLLGAIAAQRGHNDVAMDLIGKAIALDGTAAEFRNSMGNVLCALGRWDDAIASYQQATFLKPRYAEAHFNLGNAFQARDRLDEAAAQYERVLTLSPGAIDVQMNLGTVFAMQGKFDAAAAQFQRVKVEAPQLAEASYNLGHALAELGRWEEAVSQFRQAVVVKPDYVQAYCGLGNAFQQRGQLEEAVQHYRRALAIAPNHVKARIDLGWVLAEQVKLAEARAEAETAARLAHQPNFPHYLLGVLFARCGLAEAARIQFNLSLKDDPEDRRGARLCLAALGFEPMPERAPDVVLDQFYNLRAAWWNQEDMLKHPYRAAKSLAEAFQRLVGDPERLDILDAGCGAGLIGVLIERKMRGLDGIDRSAEMLARAREKNIYRELHQGDLVRFMADRPERYDVITSGAVLLHFGDLTPVFDAAATTLRDNGLFLFTLFHNAADESTVAVGSFESGQAQAGSFVHGRDYLARIAATTGFQVEMMEHEVFDQHEGAPRMGLVVALRRRARDQAP